MTDWIINPGTSIQTTINNPAVVGGDRILLNAGTYINDNTLNINKSITIMASVPGTYPNVSLNFTTYAYGLLFAVSNITLDGLDIDNIRGGGAGIGYIHNTAAISNLVIQNCKLHHFRRMFVGDGGLVNGFSLLDSQFYSCQYSFMEISNAKSLQIKRNWIYGQANTSGGEGCITYYTPADVGTTEISYNYIWGTRYGIELSPSVVNAASTGTIVVAHNTIDMYMVANKPANINVPYCERYASSYYSVGTNKLNGANIDYRDNLISRILAYKYISSGQCFSSVMNIKNCLFFDTYWYYWPLTGRSTYEYMGHVRDRLKRLVPRNGSDVFKESIVASTPRRYKALMGWGNAAITQFLNPINCMVDNPFFEMTGTDPTSFYALKAISPARGAASDGANIGAWQG